MINIPMAFNMVECLKVKQTGKDERGECSYRGPAPVGSRDSLRRMASVTDRNRERDKERILQLRK